MPRRESCSKGLLKTSEYVFPSPKTGERVNDVGKKFERAVKNAGIVDFHFHDLRHTAATRMADAGAHRFTLAAILGYSDIRMTARHTHATDEAKRRAVEKLVAPSSLETRPLPQAVLTNCARCGRDARGPSEYPPATAGGTDKGDQCGQDVRAPSEVWQRIGNANKNGEQCLAVSH